METGTYILQKNMFLAGNRKFVIKQRKKPYTKPVNYLIMLEPFQYVSSLFPAGSTSEYTFDFDSKLYSLRKIENDSKVEIIELS
jgi:hypothetical protein